MAAIATKREVIGALMLSPEYVRMKLKERMKLVKEICRRFRVIERGTAKREVAP